MRVSNFSDSRFLAQIAISNFDCAFWLLISCEAMAFRISCEAMAFRIFCKAMAFRISYEAMAFRISELRSSIDWSAKPISILNCLKQLKVARFNRVSKTYSRTNSILNLKFTVILAVKTNSHEYVHNENNRSRRLLEPWMYKGTTKS